MIVPPGIKNELRWFYEARFGMFVHFGLYSLLGRGEWVQYHENIDREEYGQLIHQFNPARFDAAEWVDLAQASGAKYLAVTAKHHDGFCLFDSALTDFKITNSPFGRDLIGELAAACQQRDLRFVIYYSQPDWRHPNYLHHPGAFKDLANPPASDRPDWPAYVRYYHGQVEELCTKYGRIDGIWFDGSHKTVEEWGGREIYELIKKHQPQAVVNDRARYGDFFTPERSLPEDLTGYMFEACESISPTAWGYQGETAAFSVPHLARSLLRMTTAGGNYLLNVGPAPDGTIPAKQARVMRALGQWLGKVGPAVYRTDPVRLDAPQNKTQKVKLVDEEGVAVHRTEEQFSALPAARFGYTRAGRSLYLHCLEWPETDTLTVPGVVSTPTRVRLLAEGTELKFRRDSAGIELYDLPPSPPDALPQVLAFEFAQTPELAEKPRPIPPVTVCPVAATGRTELSAGQAQLVGYGVKGSKLRLGEQGKFIDGWWTPEQEAHWHLRCPAAGRYRVCLHAGCAPGDLGSVISLAGPAGQILQVEMPAVGPDGSFTRLDAGELDLPAGESVLVVSPARLKWGYVFGRVEKLTLEAVPR